MMPLSDTASTADMQLVDVGTPVSRPFLGRHVPEAVARYKTRHCVCGGHFVPPACRRGNPQVLSIRADLNVNNFRHSFGNACQKECRIF